MRIRPPRAPRRRASALLVVAALALVLSLPAFAKEPAPEQEPNEAYKPSFRIAVNAAVERGVAYLRGKQQSDGSWRHPPGLERHAQGYTALMTLALLKGGVPGDDPAIEKAFATMRALPLARTYDVGVLLMALHARYAPHDGFAEEATDRYGKREIELPCKSRIPAEDQKWMKRGVAFLLEHQRDGHWRYPESGADLSNTQYALLGLWAASRCGFKVPRQAWMDSLKWLLATQERTGRPVELWVNEVRGDYRVVWREKARARGFRYMPDHPVTGSMTTAGMAGLAICQDELWSSRKLKAATRKRIRRGIRDAMAWMQDGFSVSTNPGEPEGRYHHYYLYGMERAGVLARFRFMGRFDWYKEGADWLLGTQQSHGGWDVHDYLRDTAFAVLFLRRATDRLRMPAITPR